MNIKYYISYYSISIVLFTLFSETVGYTQPSLENYTDAYGNVVAADAITSKDQTADNYDYTRNEVDGELSTIKSGIKLKVYDGQFDYIENGQAQIFEGQIVSFINPVTGIETKLPGNTNTVYVGNDGGNSYTVLQDNRGNITSPQSAIVSYLEGNSAQAADLKSIGKNAYFILYKNYASNANISNQQESTFTVTSNFVLDAKIENSEKSNLYLSKNIASRATINNTSGSYILAISNKIDGATIYNIDNSNMDIIQNYANSATIHNGIGSKLLLQGNNASNTVINNTNDGTIAIIENIAKDAQINNLGNGVITLTRNNADEADVNNVGGGSIVAIQNSLNKAKILIDGNSSFSLSKNIGTEIEMNIKDQTSMAISYGNNFQNGRIENNGIFYSGNYVDETNSENNKSSKYIEMQIDNNNIANISGALDFSQSIFTNSASAIVNVDSLQMEGGTVNNFGRLNVISSSEISNINNDGIINIATSSNIFNKLTVLGDYNSDGGTVILSTFLGDSNSATDSLHILGNAGGQTNVNIINRNGMGALTSGNGINVIKVDGSSSADAFTLQSDYKYKGKSAIIAGAYAYSLYASNASGNFDGNWYLRSLETNDANEQPTTPMEQPARPSKPVYSATAPLYEAYPQVLQKLNKVNSLEQRVGNRIWVNSTDNTQANSMNDAEGLGFWMTVEGGTGHIESNISKTDASYDIDLIKTLFGLDFIASVNANGQVVGGLYFQYGHAKADIDSPFGTGKISTDGYGFGGTLTWYGNDGLYVDGVGQLMFYDSDIYSNWLDNGHGKRVVDGRRGNGYAASIEVGKKISFNQDWAITPQMQLSYSDVDFNDFNDNYAGHISSRDGNALTGRLGLKFDKEVNWKASNGDQRHLQAYGIGNLYYDALEGTSIDLTDVTFRNRPDRLSAGIGAGLSYSMKDDAYSIYGEADARTSLTNFSDSYTFNGTVGLRARF